MINKIITDDELALDSLLRAMKSFFFTYIEQVGKEIEASSLRLVVENNIQRGKMILTNKLDHIFEINVDILKPLCLKVNQINFSVRI